MEMSMLASTCLLSPFNCLPFKLGVYFVWASSLTLENKGTLKSRSYQRVALAADLDTQNVIKYDNIGGKPDYLYFLIIKMYVVIQIHQIINYLNKRPNWKFTKRQIKLNNIRKVYT